MPADFSTIFTIIYLIIGIAVSVAIFIFLFQFYLKKRYGRIKIPQSLDMVLLQILLPKRSLKEEEEAKRDPKELIARASQLFASLYSIKDIKPDIWFYKGFYLSFEIAAFEETIKFYIAVPQELLSMIEKQITGLYPDASLEEIDRYNIFKEENKYAAQELRLSSPVTLPIKTYKEFEADTLNSITNALSKLGKKEGAAIQFLIRPANTVWQKSGEYHIKLLQESKKIGVKLGGEMARAPLKAKEEKVEEKPKGPTPLGEQQIKLISEKTSFIGYETIIRIVTSSPDISTAKMHLSNIVGAFTVFNNPVANKFKIDKKAKPVKVVENFIFRFFPYNASYNILNTEELASIFHFPNRNIETPNIVWLMSRRAPAPPEVPKEGLYLGVNIFRGIRTPIYMKKKDRQRHMYIVGKTGTGKSMFMEDLCIQDIKNGEGVCYLDPHGESIERILPQIPKERAGDVILFAPGDTARPLGLNLLEYDPKRPEQKTFAVNELLNIFEKLYNLQAIGASGPMFEQYFRNAALLVMEHPESGSTLMEIPKVLADEDFRAFKLSKCPNPVIKNYWIKEAEKAGGEAALANIVPYITSKLTQFIANDIMRPIIAQQNSAFNIREVMDNQKILLLKLEKGRIGEMNAYLLGLIMVGKIYIAAMGRGDIPEEERKNFYLYIDEFQNFTTKAVADILSEARKYALNLIIAHQFIKQLTDEIRDAVFGNVGTIVSFRVGVEDAEYLEKVFSPVFTANDIINIEKFNSYTNLLVDNTNVRPFSMNHYKDISKIKKDYKLAEAIVKLSRLKYGRDREIIEEEIRERA